MLSIVALRCSSRGRTTRRQSGAVMQYLLLISADEELAVTRMREGRVRLVRHLDHRPGAARGAARARRAARERDRDDRAAARRRGPAHRRSRSPRGASRWAGSRSWTARTSTRRSRSRRRTPRRRSGRWRSGRCGSRDRRRGAGARGHVRAGLGSPRRHPDPAHGRLGPGRGVHPGRVRRGPAHLASRRHPRRAARLAHHDRAQPGRSTGSGGSASAPRSCAPSSRRPPTSPTSTRWTAGSPTTASGCCSRAATRPCPCRRGSSWRCGRCAA